MRIPSYIAAPATIGLSSYASDSNLAKMDGAGNNIRYKITADYQSAQVE